MHVHRRTADVDGRTRRFLVIAPDNPGPRPNLLLFFHGSLQSGNVMRRFTNGTFDELADATNTVLVYPDGVDRHFNDCRSILPVTARAENVDDVAFAAFLVEEMRREFGTARTFACGYSNGGQMVLRLLFDAPFSLTRACIFASTLGEGDNHAPSNPAGYRPTPLLFSTAPPTRTHHTRAGSPGWTPSAPAAACFPRRPPPSTSHWPMPASHPATTTPPRMSPPPHTTAISPSNCGPWRAWAT
ncbi:hypothetical protein [Corynebacterium marquesiae]|uniref:alpha/beta hydrolase family esterase n=1 Tax=Corynebacterium marquesiae TaxID=2913503 RepID=UPI0038D0D59A